MVALSAPDEDPVRAQRARVAGAVAVATRLGYGLFAAAVITFFVGLATTFTSGLASVTVAFLVAGTVVLAPAIILGYAVRSAERHDREHGL